MGPGRGSSAEQQTALLRHLGGSAPRLLHLLASESTWLPLAADPEGVKRPGISTSEEGIAVNYPHKGSIVWNATPGT